MATSKDTRVRVEGRSKIIARVLPASGRSLRGRFAFMARATIDHLAQVHGRHVDQVEEVADRVHRATVSFGCLLMRMAEPRAGAVEAFDTFGDFLLVDNERRQQPHDVIAGRHRDHLFGAQRVDQLGRPARPRAGRSTVLRRALRR